MDFDDASKKNWLLIKVKKLIHCMLNGTLTKFSRVLVRRRGKDENVLLNGVVKMH